MRKLLIWIKAFIGLVMMMALHIPGIDQRPLPERFRDAMLFARYDTYTDTDFNYSFAYPSYFHRDEMVDFGVGHVQFSYHQLTDIILECKVVPQNVHPYRSKNFMREGNVDGFDDFRYFSHYVLDNGCWYILTLYYKADFKQALGGMIHHIRTWNINRPQKLNALTH